jgi:hypothetical protein
MTTEEIETYVAAQPDVWAMIVEEGREGRADTVLRFGVGSSA